MKNPLSPEVARHLVQTFLFFQTHPQDTAVNGLSKSAFEAMLKEVGAAVGKESLPEIIAFLEQLAEGNADLLDQALLPEQIKKLVADYEDFLNEQDPEVRRVRAAILTQQVEKIQSETTTIEEKTLPPGLPETHRLPLQRFTIGMPTKPAKPPQMDSKKGLAQERILYLLLRQPSDFERTWSQLLSAIPFFGGKGTTSLQNLETAIERLQIENPKEYPPDSPVILLLKEKLANLTQIQESIIKEAVFVPEDEVEEILKTPAFQNAQTFRLEINQQSGNITPRQETIIESPLSQGVAVPSFVGKTSQNLLKNLSSFLGIKLRQLLTSPNLGWIRTSLGLALGLGGLALPIFAPVKIVLGLSGAMLLLAQARFWPSVLDWPIRLIGGAVNRLPAISAPSSTSPTAPIPSLPGFKPGGPGAGKILIFVLLGVLGLLVLGFKNTSDTQSILLPGKPLDVLGSAYIALEKTTLQGHFENGALPNQLTYTIKAAPKKGKLTNAIVKDETRATGQSIDRTIASQEWKVDEIRGVWTQDFSINLDSSLKGQLNDSTIINTVTIEAAIEGVAEKQTAVTSVVIRVGTPPEDCPSGWPTAKGWVNQGPNGPATHQDTEAVDIHGNASGTNVYATHKGTAYSFRDQYKNEFREYGLDVQIFGACGGKNFSSLYVHLSSTTISKSGQAIKKGDTLGAVGCTGWCASPHVHYQFRGVSMGTPFIPIAVPRGCVLRNSCNVEW